MRISSKLAVLCFVVAGTIVLAGMFAGATSSMPQYGQNSVPPMTGKLGTPIEIFNGKNLNGWSWDQLPSEDHAPPASLRDVWSVSDGVLHSKGKPTGALVFDREFTNYVLTAEERQLEAGNGGLLVGITKLLPSWPGLEIQTMTGDAGDLWNHNLLKMTGDPSRTVSGGKRIVKAGPDSQKPVGEWDTMEVIVDSGYLVFKVNGVVQNVVTDTESLAGKVGLQSEGVPMEFRKIEVTPIEPAK